MMFEVVIVRKNTKERTLEVFLRRFICYSIHKHEFTSDKLLQVIKCLENEKKTSEYLKKIHKYEVFGVIESQEIVIFLKFH